MLAWGVATGKGTPSRLFSFCIAEEVLARLFDSTLAAADFQPAMASHRLSCPTYLLYADDILIFCTASRANTRCLKLIMDRYADFSGQVFNPAKSKVYFGRHVPPHNRRYIQASLGIGIGDLPFTYLGVPLFRGAPKSMHLRGICDRILTKFAAWKGTALSLAGRVCLINSVITSSLVHSMMVYKWPRSLLARLEKAMRNFIWTGKVEKADFCTVAWVKSCASKDEDGLGIRSIKLMNEAQLLKLAWTVITDKGPNMDFVRSHFWKGSVARAHIPSSVWGGIRPCAINILGEARWILEKTPTVRFWLDN
ncbi:hypothetical protein ACS0TY_027528 [Phlomoides rotata]